MHGKRLLGWIGVLLAIGLLLTLAVPPKVATAPVMLSRDDNGDWQTADGSAWPPKPLLSWQLRKAEEQTNLNYWSSESSTQSARFSCARVAILPQSDHLLLKRVAEGMVSEWMQQPFAQEITYCPGGALLPMDAQAPDLYILLNLDHVQHRMRRVTAKVTVKAFTRPGQHYGIYGGQFHLPLVDFDWSGEADYQSSKAGVASRSMQYQAEGKAIARQLAKSLGEDCAKKLKKYGELPALPAIFTPAYQPPPLLEFLGRYDTHRVAFTHGLLMPTNAYWQIRAPKPELRRILKAIRSRQKIAGWRVERQQEGYNCILTRGNPAERLLIGHRDGLMDTPPHLDVLYQTCLPDAELQQAVDGLLADPAQAQLALLFYDRLSPAQRDRVLARMQELPPSRVTDCLALAEICKARNELAEAGRMLQRANVMTRCVGQSADSRQSLLDGARELGVELKVTEPLLRQCGFQTLAADGSFPRLPIAPGQDARYYLRTDKGFLTLSIGMQPFVDTPSTQAQCLEYNDEGSCTSTGGDLGNGTVFTGSFGSFSKWRFLVERDAADKERFTVVPQK